jgi:hypothetical protein
MRMAVVEKVRVVLLERVGKGRRMMGEARYAVVSGRTRAAARKRLLDDMVEGSGVGVATRGVWLREIDVDL